MPTSIDLAQHDLMAVSRTGLAALRAALVRDHGPRAAAALQEAGYAGGAGVFAAFRSWLAERGERDPEVMDLAAFRRAVGDFFRETGWGTHDLGSLDDAVATVDSPDWSEADPAEQLEHPGCHYTTGLLSYFYGQVSGAPLSVLEVECRSAGAPRCRFLMGNTEVLGYVFDQLERGTPYQDALTRVS